MSDNAPDSRSREEDLLEDLVARCINALERDGVSGVEQIYRENPAHADRLRERVSWLSGQGLVHRESQPQEQPEAIGPYRIRSVLGEGGMGTVYRADQEEPIRRQVALKVIKLGMDSAQVLRRFEAERQALAMMEHSSIAKVFDAGTTDRGQPYFAMEYVKGMPITEHCDHYNSSVEERIDLFRQVCSGVQHAHQKGVVHRDLKPSNVLVSVPDGNAIPVIIDFGLARATEQDLIQATMLTEQGLILGTPEYMSPEQAGLGGQDVDTRTDVYSLGVLLYELLVGELPFSSKELRQAGRGEMERKIQEVEPPKPSTNLSSQGNPHAAHHRGTDTRTLLRRLRGDLDWVVMKAIDKDRERRYATPDALADDLRRHLRHEPVIAGPPSAGYRMRKLVRRYRGQVVAGALLFVTLIAGIVSFAIANARANVNARAAKDSEVAAIDARDAESVARGEAESALERFNLLANVVKLSEAKAAETELYPAWPDKVEAMERWLTQQAEPLEQELGELQQALEELRSKAVDPTEEELEARASLTDEIESLRAEIAAAQPEWAFDDQADKFLHDTLAMLRTDLEAFVAPESGELSRVRERQQWASGLRELSITSHEARWEQARLALRNADGISASTLYASEAPLDLQPQMGLVPIGMNPVTRLWEFYHLRSTADPTVIPEHDDAGIIEITEETGVVFVLIPGGTAILGAQKSDPDGLNYDPQAMPTERIREYTMEPYFLARYELTQAQWERLSNGGNPARYHTGFQGAGMSAAVTPTHPVEQVTWEMCDSLLTRHGLQLPLDVQWEYACRALAEPATPWSTGTTAVSLAGHANILDRTTSTAAPGWGKGEDFDDGFIIHAPVGSFLPNAFGLFDMHGNVWEWVQDLFQDTQRLARGGGLNSRALDARTANRVNFAPTFQFSNLGVRPARVIHRQ